jgi:uncharacterized protein with PIN domain
VFDHDAALREGLTPLLCKRPGCGALLGYTSAEKLHLSEHTVTYNRVLIRCVKCGRPYTWRPGRGDKVDSQKGGVV